MHPATLPIDELLKQCTISRDRSRGPGGQHRSKNETAVEITHDPTGLQAQSSNSRSQEENRKRALRQLRVRLAVRHRDFVPVPGYRKSDLLNSRIHKGRLAVNPKHPDYPAVLAEVMDLLYELNGEVRKASEFLDLSSSQIIKFVKTEPEAFAQLNAYRRAKSKRPLK